jgi:hypothetical protein
MQLLLRTTLDQNAFLQSISAFFRIAETIYPFVFTQFRAQNRYAVLLELLQQRPQALRRRQPPLATLGLSDLGPNSRSPNASV